MKQELFPIITTLSLTEMNELANAMNQPVVQKYLHSLGTAAIRDICGGQRNSGESAESYLERVARVQGGLATIEQLLAIEPAAPATSSS